MIAARCATVEGVASGFRPTRHYYKLQNSCAAISRATRFS